MSCDCKKTFTEKFLEKVKAEYPTSTDHKVEIENYAIVFSKNGNCMSLKGFMPVVVQHKVIVKKTGLSKVKKEKTSLLFSYCPFCGVDLREPKPKETENATS